MRSRYLATCFALLLFASASLAQEAAVPREALRYDGKPFEYPDGSVREAALTAIRRITQREPFME